MKIVYTESAEKELQSFLKKQQDTIEKVVHGHKYVYGDEVIEITASDIRDASRDIVVIESRRNYMRELIIRVYFVIGALTLGYGLFREYLSNMLDNPIRTLLIGIGGIMMFASYMLKVMFDMKDAQKKQHLRDVDKAGETKR